MAPIIRALNQHPNLFNIRVIATAQHRQMLDQVLSLFNIRPDLDMDLMRPDQSLLDVTQRVLRAMGDLLENQRPDLVMAEGDTTTVMATSVSCFYAGVPFAHVEAGLRTGDPRLPYPEEFNRRIVALTARLHFAPTQRARSNLLREGIPDDHIWVTGNTVIDSLVEVLRRGIAPTSALPNRPYVLMTCHRRESFGEAVREVFETIRDVAARHPDLLFWYPVHPNTNVAVPAREILASSANVLLSEPLDYLTFVNAMSNARLLISDSGGVQEEATFLGKPTLVLRDVTERPEAVDEGPCILVGTRRRQIETHIETLLADPVAYSRAARQSAVFGNGHAAELIASHMQDLVRTGGL